MAEDINSIAFKTLNDRMLREMANSLLRLATKKALELAARKSDQKDLGTAISIVNALTEKADTRNWQTLPYEIGYARISLPPGKQTITFTARNKDKSTSKDIEVNITKGRLSFITYSDTESLPLQERTQ